MVFVCGFCNGCANAAVQEYKVRYTDRNGPTGQTFYTVFQHLCDKVSFPGIGARAWEHGWDKFFAQHNSPGISTRIGRLGIFHMKAWRCKGIRIFTHITCIKFVSRMEILRHCKFVNCYKIIIIYANTLYSLMKPHLAMLKCIIDVMNIGVLRKILTKWKTKTSSTDFLLMYDVA